MAPKKETPSVQDVSIKVADLQIEDAGVLLDKVQDALIADSEHIHFAVGGSIDLNAEKPLTLRWDDPNGKWFRGRKCVLPVGEEVENVNAFNKLLEDCQPATFGLRKKDVLDESYRKAGAMDEKCFSSNFNLSDYNVLDTVAQVLIQSKFNGGVTAELYKLNVYSAPSGKFKAHVDTPRAENHVGSLVVCLPYEHEGGALAVRHGGKEILFDWAKKSADTIQWAALFADCEHEVHEVTKGHRLTLTYHLYRTDGGPGGMAEQLNVIDQEKLHFYAALKKLHECPAFLPKGGSIGFSCNHFYPHHSRAVHFRGQGLDRMLKGIDMAVYQAFRRISNVVRCEAYAEDDYEDEYSDSEASSSPSEDGENNLTTKSWVTTRGPGSTDNLGEIDEDERFKLDMAGFGKGKIVWLSGVPGSFTEAAVAYIVHGNQAELYFHYSAAVILARIAPYEERMKKSEVTEQPSA